MRCDRCADVFERDDLQTVTMQGLCQDYSPCFETREKFLDANCIDLCDPCIAEFIKGWNELIEHALGWSQNDAR